MKMYGGQHSRVVGRLAFPLIFRCCHQPVPCRMILARHFSDNSNKNKVASPLYNSRIVFNKSLPKKVDVNTEVLSRPLTNQQVAKHGLSDDKVDHR